MAKFVVDRRTWHRGKGSPGSRLLTVEGNRCCIGFVGQQCGVSDKTLLNVGTVAVLEPEHIQLFPYWMKPGAAKDNGPLQEAYTLNDSTDIEDEERERGLKALFVQNGDEIVFEN